MQVFRHSMFKYKALLSNANWRWTLQTQTDKVPVASGPFVWRAETSLKETLGPLRVLPCSSLLTRFAHLNHQMWISEHVSGSSCQVAECGLSISPRCWVTTGWSLSQLCNLATSFRLYNRVPLQSIWRADKWQFEMCPRPPFSFQPKTKGTQVTIFLPSTGESMWSSAGRPNGWFQSERWRWGQVTKTSSCC